MSWPLAVFPNLEVSAPLAVVVPVVISLALPMAVVVLSLQLVVRSIVLRVQTVVDPIMVAVVPIGAAVSVTIVAPLMVSFVLPIYFAMVVIVFSL